MLYKTRDWITIAMTAAVFGVFFTFLDSFYSPLSNLLGPVFMSLTFGVYALSALFPLYLTRKPGAALIGSLFAALINILTGSPYGIHIIIAGGLQGLGAELGFGLGKYRSFSLLNFFIAAIFITAFVSARDYFVFGLGQLTMPLFLASIAVRIASATVISWLICLGLGAALRKTGIVRFNKSSDA
jgi:energy-coupling factor transport system substrate-specific component